jgi:hypothetical protein
MSGAAVVAGGALLAYELLAARRLRAAGAE